MLAWHWDELLKRFFWSVSVEHWQYFLNYKSRFWQNVVDYKSVRNKIDLRYKISFIFENIAPRALKLWSSQHNEMIAIFLHLLATSSIHSKRCLSIFEPRLSKLPRFCSADGILSFFAVIETVDNTSVPRTLVKVTYGHWSLFSFN